MLIAVMAWTPKRQEKENAINPQEFNPLGSVWAQFHSLVTENNIKFYQFRFGVLLFQLQWAWFQGRNEAGYTAGICPPSRSPPQVAQQAWISHVWLVPENASPDCPYHWAGGCQKRSFLLGTKIWMCGVQISDSCRWRHIFHIPKKVGSFFFGGREEYKEMRLTMERTWLTAPASDM